MTYRLARLFAGAALATACAIAHATDAATDDIVRFDISRFDVTGNTLLAPAVVDQAVAPFTGKARDFGDVQRALEALEEAYRAAGYTVVTVELPEQELERGIVQLRVVQTKMGRVTVRGNRHFDEANVRRSLPGLQEGRTPNVTAISDSLQLANDNPARKVALKLQGSPDREAEVDATLEVQDERPWKAIVNVDNTGTAQTGRTRTGVVLQHANLWNRDHVMTLQYTTTVEHPGSVKVYGAGYHIPLYAQGDALDFYASYSNVDSGTVAAGVLDVAVSGKGAVYGARYTQNLARRGNLQSKLQYGVDYKAYKNSIVVLGQELGNDVTVHPASLAWVGTVTRPGSELGASLALVRNVPGGRRGGQDDFERARAGARDDYTLLRLGASWSRVLPGDWQARAIVNAQYTRDALVPGEQFGAGGAGSVRGFAEREIANDRGAGANLEVYTPDLCGVARSQCRLLAFYDAAWVRRNDALPGELASTAIGSAGVGLRLFVSTYVNLQLDYGHVVRAGATGRADANRLHARLGLSF
ncbi:ShlB/FhaC/HecB family hemolysin secretion/activation protein [Pseudoduganella chitinolytica]|uniref:ShlB/FhaC/HecB family hemolysin secretion/activation protein n=1 Tax=Pseudoduganella chitinolytica TaxID=34070 RepID=A0ABY8BBY4_9BURK|nr:ShlB/FhaC/HecB family hemolysin secretion/activation protein [Pseudoduganella chitinolytica]WEF33417.1 ShlB/FhaC/HecB family hemolysin secretion/activation protein [Pseudoduganella chitinolytica]